MDPTIIAALNEGTLNDVVTLSQPDAADITLVPTLDSTAGGIRWVADPDPSAAMKQHIRTKKWIIPMLNHHTRNTLYAATITHLLKPLPSTAPVLDIGTGSGLLALLASKTNPVTTLEMSTPMSEIATSIIADNAQTDHITLHNTHSNDYVPPSTPPSLCTSGKQMSVPE